PSVLHLEEVANQAMVPLPKDVPPGAQQPKVQVDLVRHLLWRDRRGSLFRQVAETEGRRRSALLVVARVPFRLDLRGHSPEEDVQSFGGFLGHLEQRPRLTNRGLINDGFHDAALHAERRCCPPSRILPNRMSPRLAARTATGC